MNPTAEELSAEEEALLDLRVQELRVREGLMQDDKGLFFGYLTRGKPKKALSAAMTEASASLGSWVAWGREGMQG